MIMENKDFDVIIIGSGIGGLSTAVSLVKSTELRCLVLEQHDEIGGLMQSFSRKGYKFDVGLHYVGKMKKNSYEKIFFDYLTDNKIKWVDLPYNFELFKYPSFEFKVPSKKSDYINKLLKIFPKEEIAIKRYFKDIKKSSFLALLKFSGQLMPKTIFYLLNMFLSDKKYLMTTKEYLDLNFKDEKLKLLLCSQWLDYGMTPEQSSFGIHSIIVNHYIDGGGFPSNGSVEISKVMEQIILRNGGEVLTSTEVKEIIFSKNTVTGVKAFNKITNEEVIYKSKYIVSSVGIETTYKNLIKGNSSYILDELEDYKNQIKTLSSANSAITLYLGLKDSPEKLGFNGENIWINNLESFNNVSKITLSLLENELISGYLSFPSLKLHNTNKHTVQLITMVNPLIINEYVNSSNISYLELKVKIQDTLINELKKLFPDLIKLVDYYELSMPSTIERYTNRINGALYGLPATPQLWRTKLTNIKTSFKNLYISGSDVCSLGIVGSMMGGIGATSKILDNMNPFINGFLRFSYSTFFNKNSDNHYKYTRSTLNFNSLINSIVLEKEYLTDTVILVKFLIGKTPNKYFNIIKGGQILRVYLSLSEYRDYSISNYYLDDNNLLYVECLIDTKFGGYGSQFIKNININSSVNLRIPMGSFLLNNSITDKVFYVTGTGISPILLMLKKLSEIKFKGKVKLVYGCKNEKSNLIEKINFDDYKDLDLEIVISITKPENQGNFYLGRITEYFKNIDSKNKKDREFYICGNPEMVKDMENLLKMNGIEKIYHEKY